MSERLDKRVRKEKRDQARAMQRAAARAKLPLPDKQMQRLFEMLDAALPSHRCDHTLRLVREWAQKQGLPFDPIAAWCRDNSGFCDCEVLANCQERWKDAVHDVDW